MKYLSQVALFLLATSMALGLDIVRDGKPVAQVVVSSLPTGVKPQRVFEPSDVMAAQVLVSWIKKMTDAELPITATPADERQTIYIGEAAIGAGLKLNDIHSQTNEGLRVIVVGQKALIAGQSSIATVRAVCRFLEAIGCRYLMEGPLGEVYPRLKTLKVNDFTLTEKPGFLSRRIWGSQWSGDSLWKIWNGAGGLNLETGHSWGSYIPQSLFHEHPEYFRMNAEGQRVMSEWLCTSNAELRALFAQRVIEAICKGRTHPSISPPDGTAYCQCQSCKAQDNPNSIEPSSGAVSMTDRFINFFNDIAKRVAKECPQSILNFYCYADYTQPPSRQIALATNLCPWLAPIRYCRFHSIGSSSCPPNQQLAEVIEGWSKVAKQMGYRTYNYNLAECTVPFSKLSVWSHDIPYLYRKGFIGINIETLPAWHIYGPHIYLSIRLSYQPDADAKALMDDYFTKFYGDAAGQAMKEYWLTIDNAFAKMRCHSGSFFALHLAYTPEVITRCQALLERAKELAHDEPVYLARIAMAEEGFQNAVQYLQLRDAINRGDFASAKAVYEKLLSRSEAHVKSGYGSQYTAIYLKRFLGTVVEKGAAATSPPRCLLQVLPDMWRFTWDERNEGLQLGYHLPQTDDSKWLTVATYSQTLDAQGLPDKKTILWYRTSFRLPQDYRRLYQRLFLFFAEVDGTATVYLNGRQVGEHKERRTPFEVEITDAARAGENLLAVRVDHSRITELFLGGIVRPVLLIAVKHEAE